MEPDLFAVPLNIPSGLLSCGTGRVPRKIRAAMFLNSLLRSLRFQLRRSRRKRITAKVLTSTRFAVSHSAVFISYPSGRPFLSIKPTRPPKS
jgi:hypothetical protein